MNFNIKTTTPMTGPKAHMPYSVTKSISTDLSVAYKAGEKRTRAMTLKQNSDYEKAMNSAIKNSKEIGRIRSFDPSK